MASRLILNADDFGLTRGINRAVAALHRAGVLTSATLMATGTAFEDAVTLAHALPTLGVGCHIILVDGTPVSPPRNIPTLLSKDKRHFRPTLVEFVRDFLLRRIDPAEIAYEAAAQLAKLRYAGIAVTHIDTHKHLHLLPAVVEALLRVSTVPALRNPFEPTFSRSLPGTSLFRRLEFDCLARFEPTFMRRANGILTTDGTVGIAATGRLSNGVLSRILRSLPAEGTYELCCHPGYDDASLRAARTRLLHHRDIEREALLAEIPKILTLPNAPELIHYGNL